MGHTLRVEELRGASLCAPIGPSYWPSISIQWRRCFCSGSMCSSSSNWAAESECAVVIQHARQLTWTLADRSEPIRFLIRDRHQTFTDGFDDVFRSDGIEILRTPFRTPPANGVAERFVPTIRSECLDWISSEARTISSKCFASSLITTTATGLIEPWPSRHRNLCGWRLQIGRALMSSAAIDLAV